MVPDLDPHYLGLDQNKTVERRSGGKRAKRGRVMDERVLTWTMKGDLFMNLKSIARAILWCSAVFAASAIFFTCLTFWRPDLDVWAGARAMTAMFALCAGTALAVEAADRRNL